MALTPRAAAVLLVLSLAASGCSALTGHTLPQLVNDTSLTGSVKTRIARSEGWATLRSIGVRTHDDMVYLTGVVP
ncbi:MAG TPA: BON domain-containing protein, partial [Methylomirabilota bacterium]|nr:BON domain-containing protein [Methylomirabilota bacterium]